MQIHGISMHICMLYKCIYIKLLILVDFFRNPQALYLVHGPGEPTGTT